MVTGARPEDRLTAAVAKFGKVIAAAKATTTTPAGQAPAGQLEQPPAPPAERKGA